MAYFKIMSLIICIKINEDDDIIKIFQLLSSSAFLKCRLHLIILCFNSHSSQTYRSKYQEKNILIYIKSVSSKSQATTSMTGGILILTAVDK